MGGQGAGKSWSGSKGCQPKGGKSKGSKNMRKGDKKGCQPKGCQPDAGYRRRKDPEAPPRTILPPTLMQLYPTGWLPGDPPCYMMLANWHDAADIIEPGFISKNNIVLVLRAAGQQYDGSPAKPANYPFNRHLGRAPDTVDCPVNNRSILQERWYPICRRCIRAWKSSKDGAPPNMVLVHCNEGINRGPALMSIIAGKLMARRPIDMAAVLANYRAIA